jgi:dUTP pyrophosphatase
MELIKLNPNAVVPSIAYDSAAFDLFMPTNHEDVLIPPNSTQLIHLGFKLFINDPNYCALILPRSGTGTKGLVLGNLTGLIDWDYQGEWMVQLWNRTDEYIAVTASKAIAQCLITQAVHLPIQVVESFSESTERGSRGFGSSS